MCIERLTAGRFIIHSITIKGEGAVRGINADCSGAILEQCNLQSLHIPTGHVGVTLHTRSHEGRIIVAQTILKHKNASVKIRAAAVLNRKHMVLLIAEGSVRNGLT